MCAKYMQQKNFAKSALARNITSTLRASKLTNDCKIQHVRKTQITQTINWERHLKMTDRGKV